MTCLGSLLILNFKASTNIYHLILKPETISKSLVNQMLLSFGTMFGSQVGECGSSCVFCGWSICVLSVQFNIPISSQDSKGMLSLLGTIEQSLKAGKKQAWHSANVTNICVGLLAGLKVIFSCFFFPSLYLSHTHTQTLRLWIFNVLYPFLMSMLTQALLALRPEPLGLEVLNATQSIFQVFCYLNSLLLWVHW